MADTDPLVIRLLSDLSFAVGVLRAASKILGVDLTAHLDEALAEHLADLCNSAPPDAAPAEGGRP